MSLKSLLVPEIIKTFHSEYNGQIKLEKFIRTFRLDVDGLTQSGDVMVWIWSTGINNILPKEYVPESILVLGLGGGSSLFWLRKRFPKAQITAIEIDPVMIDIANKYFKVGKIKNLEIINADALEYIKSSKQNDEHWSLILVDCYQGSKTPSGFGEIPVLKKLKQKADIVLINRLYWDEHKATTDEFVDKISHHFTVKSVYTTSNLVIKIS